MAAPIDGFRIIKPYIPSLFETALVKVALPLFNEFDIEILDEVVSEIKHFNQIVSNEDRQENIYSSYNRAKAKLLFIPGQLRKRVLGVVHSFTYEINFFKSKHCSILYSEVSDLLFKEFSSIENIVFCWRSDRTINQMKTAQRLVSDARINIRTRFVLASLYCSEKDIRALWAEIEESGIKENVEKFNNPMVLFWVKWVSVASKTPWIEGVKEYLTNFLGHGQLFTPIIFASFFPLLKPCERERFLPYIAGSSFDDLLICLYYMTKEEQDQILNLLSPTELLYIYLCNWPLQSIFLETAEKMWTLFTDFKYPLMLEFISRFIGRRKDYDYSELLEDFWSRSPDYLKEKVKEYPRRDKIYSNLKQFKRKREDDGDDGTNRKKWIRKNGRLESTH